MFRRISRPLSAPLRPPPSSAPPSSSEPESEPESVAEKLESIRPDGTTDRPLSDADVSDVLGEALRRVRAAVDNSAALLREETQRLLSAAASTRELTQRLTEPPAGLSSEAPDTGLPKPPSPAGGER